VTQKLTPHIVVQNAASMAEWYRRALRATVGQPVTVPDGRIMSLEVRFDEAVVMVCDEFPEMGIVSPKALGGTYGALVLASDDVDRDWQQAMAAGAEVFHPLQDNAWGARSGQLIDPSGHRWGLSQPVSSGKS
jgi:PhnB protein